MAARRTTKGRSRKSAVKCGYVDGQYIDKGWSCCACFKKRGAGTYNSPNRNACKVCSHARCEGAMDRKWAPPGIAPLVVQEYDGSLLGSIARGLFASAMRTVSEGSSGDNIPAEWEKACNEVASAFTAANVHAEFSGRKAQAAAPYEVIAKRIRKHLPQAMRLFGSVHAPGDAPCDCRHSVLIYLAAHEESEATGRPIESLFKSGESVLDWYLKSVS
jgi:hypothetical protein